MASSSSAAAVAAANTRAPKEHACSLCDKTFTRRSDKTRHERQLHQDVRAWQCPRCDSSHRQRPHCETHVLSHYDESRLLKCPFCSVDLHTADEAAHTRHFKKEHELTWNSKKVQVDTAAWLQLPQQVTAELDRYRVWRRDHVQPLKDRAKREVNARNSRPARRQAEQLSARPALQEPEPQGPELQEPALQQLALQPPAIQQPAAQSMWVDDSNMFISPAALHTFELPQFSTEEFQWGQPGQLQAPFEAAARQQNQFYNEMDVDTAPHVAAQQLNQFFIQNLNSEPAPLTAAEQQSPFRDPSGAAGQQMLCSGEVAQQEPQSGDDPSSFELEMQRHLLDYLGPRL